MLLFGKVLGYSLHLTSWASLSILSMSLLGLWLQLKQSQLVTISRSSFCNCLPFRTILLSPGTAISIRWHFLSVLYNTTMSGLLCWMTWSVWILKSHNILALSFPNTLAGLRLYHLTSPTKQNFWNSSKITILAILSCLFLYSFWAIFLHSVIKLVIDSSLSPHMLHSDTSWPSIFFLIQFILKVCSCTADIKSSASFFK